MTTRLVNGKRLEMRVDELEAFEASRAITPREALADAREAAIQEAVQDVEAARIAAIRAQVEPDFAGATTAAEIQTRRETLRAKAKARRGPRG